MKESSLFNVYSLPPVPNVCNQELREVMQLTNLSLAHVIMIPGNKSLPHKHLKMHEIYYILSGKGVFYKGKECFDIKKGSCVVLPPDTTHFLYNKGQEDLEHLVIAVPPFDAADIVLEREKIDDSYRPTFDERKKENPEIVAPDGGIVNELLSPQECEALQMSLATGYLPPYKRARPHYHKIGEEIYYIVRGRGRVAAGKIDTPIRQGDVIYIPTESIHGLENISYKNLDVLCISTPPYADEDFLTKK